MIYPTLVAVIITPCMNEHQCSCVLIMTTCQLCRRQADGQQCDKVQEKVWSNRNDCNNCDEIRLICSDHSYRTLCFVFVGKFPMNSQHASTNDFQPPDQTSACFRQSHPWKRSRGQWRRFHRLAPLCDCCPVLHVTLHVACVFLLLPQRMSAASLAPQSTTPCAALVAS